MINEMNASRSEESEEKIPQTQLRVLLIEDSMLDAAIFQKQILKERGETVWIFHVKSLRMAIQAMKKRSFDLIILDLNLPDSDGLETITTLKQTCNNLPIIVLTGTADEIVQRRALELGADDYVIKNSMSPNQFWLNLTSTFSRFHRQRIETHAREDLPERIIFEDRTQCVVSRSLREKLTSTVILAEVVGHKTQTVDLKETYQLLSRTFRSSDAVCRISDKIFAFVFADIKEIENTESLARKIENVFKQLPSIEKYFLGVSIFPMDAKSATELLLNAEHALEKAKKDDVRLRFYEPILNLHLSEIQSVSASIEKALNTHEISPLYNPIFDLSSHEIFGFEILSNIEISSAQGLLSGARSELGFKVFREVFDEITPELQSWKNIGMKSTIVSFNLSESDIYDNERFENIYSWIELGLISPESLCFEIPERFLNLKSNILLDRLNTFKNLGVQLALDHFGSGICALAVLRKFPFDSVKIHSSLIEKLHRAQDDFKTVKAIIESAHIFEKKIICEGVKTQEQVDLLTALHCDLAQGPIFGQNIAMSEIRNFCKEKSKMQSL